MAHRQVNVRGVLRRRGDAHADRRVGEIDLHIDIAWLHWPGYLRKQGPEVTECSVALQTRPLLVGCTRRRDVGRGLARYRCGFALIEPCLLYTSPSPRD